MYTLILVFSLKSLYNHSIDTLVVSNLITDKQCLTLGKTLGSDMLQVNSDIKVSVYCEETTNEIELK